MKLEGKRKVIETSSLKENPNKKEKYHQSFAFSKYVFDENYQFGKEKNKIVLHREGFSRRLNTIESLEIFLSSKNPRTINLNEQIEVVNSLFLKNI